MSDASGFTRDDRAPQTTSVFDQNNNQQQTQDVTHQEDNKQTNTEDNTFNKKDFWNNKDDDPNKQTQQTQQTDQNDVQKLQNEAREHLNKILNGQDFMPKDLDDKAIAEQLGNGDISGVKDMMQQVARDVMGKTMMLMGQITDARIKEAVDTAVQRAGGNMNTSKAVEKLEAAMEIANDEAYRPLVLQTFGKAMKNNQGNVDAAIRDTKAMFKGMTDYLGEDKSNGKARQHNDLRLPTVEDGSQPNNWVDALKGT